jgi:hypothetical protein
MSLDYKEMENALQNFIDSDAGKAYFENMKKINDIKVGRYKRFEEWLKNNDFDELMLRLIHEHGEDYCEKCYHNGYEPYPNRKLAFLIDYLVHNYEPIEVLEIEPEHFPSTIYFFKGYYFQTICGQGCFHRIYNKEDMQMILQV